MVACDSCNACRLSALPESLVEADVVRLNINYNKFMIFPQWTGALKGVARSLLLRQRGGACALSQPSLCT
jgi:hypothetical protein